MRKMKFTAISVMALVAFLIAGISLHHYGQPVNRATTPGDSTMIIYGDSRSNHEIHSKIIECILTLDPVAVFHTGDLVYNGKNEEHWSIFNSIVADLLKQAPLYPAIGNHELGTLQIQQELELPNGGKWYSVDLQGIHFVMLDVVSDYKKGSEQYLWLENDLRVQPENTAFTVVITHYPFYTTGFHRTEIDKLRNELIPLFKEYGVDIVFSGHNHAYERCMADDIYYITTAGGGAPLYNQKAPEDFSQLFIKTFHFCTLNMHGDSLIVHAVDTNMNVIDDFYLLK